MTIHLHFIFYFSIPLYHVPHSLQNKSSTPSNYIRDKPPHTFTFIKIILIYPPHSSFTYHTTQSIMTKKYFLFSFLCSSRKPSLSQLLETHYSIKLVITFFLTISSLQTQQKHIPFISYYNT